MSENLPAILGGTPIRPDLPAWPPRDDATNAVFAELASSGAWGQYDGPYCNRVAETLRSRLNSQHVRLTASGTAAVEYALRALGVSAGDEVILAGWDFKANFGDIVALGATPVLVDVRADNAQLDVELVANAVTEKTRAIVASHLSGQAVDMPALRQFADAQELFIVEDACQTPLAPLYGRPAASWGDVGVISFGGSKTLTAGRGGAVITNDSTFAQRMQLHDWRGNRLSPLSEMQAAILEPQLDSFDERYSQRSRAARWFHGTFAGVKGLAPFPESRSGADYYKFPFWYDAREFDGLSRERFCEAMHAEGVTLSPGFPALEKTQSARRYIASGSLVNAAKAGSEIVSLHHPLLLETEKQWQDVIEAVERVRAAAHQIKAPTA